MATLLQPGNPSDLALAGALRALRTTPRGGLARGDTKQWCARISTLLGSPQRGGRLAGVLLCQETVLQCDEASLGQHRQAWTAALLSLLAKQESHTLSCECVVALMHILNATAAWPVQRHDVVTVTIPRMISALWPLLAEEGTQEVALRALLQLAAEVPHSLRAHAAKISAAGRPSGRLTRSRRPVRLHCPA